MRNGEIVISLFCGGRGSATLIRELLRHPNITLHLLVNAYDDGLSTGALREFVPGMLGPSDFRKNLSYLLDFFSDNQYSLEQFIEYRLPKDFAEKDLAAMRAYVDKPSTSSSLRQELQELLQSLDKELRDTVFEYLRVFFAYHATSEQDFDLRDCSLGNLVFAGAFLTHGRDFNAATEELAKAFKSQAHLYNVTRSENRILTAIKEDGEVLSREEHVVSEQSSVRILDLFLLENGLTPEQEAELSELSLDEKHAYLRNLDNRPMIAADVEETLLRSDIILFGPGTQFSSLLPSYMAVGLADAIAKSRALVKAFISNLAPDYDIQGFDVADLVDKALHFLGDTNNERGLLTHILYHRPEEDGSTTASGSPDEESSARFHERGDWLSTERLTTSDRYKNAQTVPGNFANPVRASVHNGHATVSKFLELYQEAVAGPGGNMLDLYVDLHKRSLARKQLWQEFLELDWKKLFSAVRLQANQSSLPETELPGFMKVSRVDHDSLFSEVDVFLDWLKAGDTEYLMTLTGDGEYRLEDGRFAIDVLKSGSFGAVHGSRNQSRRQLQKSIRSAYGESQIVYWVSWFGAFLTSGLFALRHKVIFSDPLTGFRVYCRSRLSEEVCNALAAKHPATATGLTKILVRHGVEIAEVPVLYRTFQGFTDVKWRLRRGLRSAWGLLF